MSKFYFKQRTKWKFKRASYHCESILPSTLVISPWIKSLEPLKSFEMVSNVIAHKEYTYSKKPFGSLASWKLLDLQLRRAQMRKKSRSNDRLTHSISIAVPICITYRHYTCNYLWRNVEQRCSIKLTYDLAFASWTSLKITLFHPWSRFFLQFNNPGNFRGKTFVTIG